MLRTKKWNVKSRCSWPLWKKILIWITLALVTIFLGVINIVQELPGRIDALFLIFPHCVIPPNTTDNKHETFEETFHRDHYHLVYQLEQFDFVDRILARKIFPQQLSQQPPHDARKADNRSGSNTSSISNGATTEEEETKEGSEEEGHFCRAYRKARAHLRLERLLIGPIWWRNCKLRMNGLAIHSIPGSLAQRRHPRHFFVIKSPFHWQDVLRMDPIWNSPPEQLGFHPPPVMEFHDVFIQWHSWEFPVIDFSASGIRVNLVVDTLSRNMGVLRPVFRLGHTELEKVMQLIPPPPEEEGLYPRIGVINITNITVSLFQLSKSENNTMELKLLNELNIPDRLFMPLLNVTLEASPNGIDQMYFQPIMENALMKGLLEHLTREEKLRNMLSKIAHDAANVRDVVLEKLAKHNDAVDNILKNATLSLKQGWENILRIWEGEELPLSHALEELMRGWNELQKNLGDRGEKNASERRRKVESPTLRVYHDAVEGWERVMGEVAATLLLQEEEPKVGFDAFLDQWISKVVFSFENWVDQLKVGWERFHLEVKKKQLELDSKMKELSQRPPWQSEPRIPKKKRSCGWQVLNPKEQCSTDNSSAMLEQLKDGWERFQSEIKNKQLELEAALKELSQNPPWQSEYRRRMKNHRHGWWRLKPKEQCSADKNNAFEQLKDSWERFQLEVKKKQLVLETAIKDLSRHPPWQSEEKKAKNKRGRGWQHRELNGQCSVDDNCAMEQLKVGWDWFQLELKKKQSELGTKIMGLS